MKQLLVIVAVLAFGLLTLVQAANYRGYLQLDERIKLNGHNVRSFNNRTGAVMPKLGDYSGVSLGYRNMSSGQLIMATGVRQLDITHQLYLNNNNTTGLYRLGFGTKTPAGTIDVRGTTSNTAIYVRDVATTTSGGGRLVLQHNNAVGNFSYPTLNDRLGVISFGTRNEDVGGSATYIELNPVALFSRAAENLSLSARGSDFYIETTGLTKAYRHQVAKFGNDGVITFNHYSSDELTVRRPALGIGTGTTAPAAMIETKAAGTTKSARFGDGSSYTEMWKDGTLRMSGSATTYEDLRIDSLSTKGGASSAPTFTTGFAGDGTILGTYEFKDTGSEYLYFTVQMPHAWKTGSSIMPHVHVSPTTTNTGNIQFVFDCSWQNINGVFPASSSYTVTKNVAANSQWTHLIASNASSKSMAGLGISAIGICRIRRDNSVGSNLTGNVSMLYIDFHYEIDGFGSDEEYIKN